MNNLQVIEKDGLIKVYETDKGEKVVNGRELHEGLGVSRDFSDWIKSNLENVEAVKNTDYIRFPFKREANNAILIDYILKLDIAKEICMIAGANPRASKELKQKSKEYRRYFIKVEKKYKEQQKPTCIEDVLIQSLQEMKAIKYEITATKEIATKAKQEIQDMRDVRS